MSALRDRKSISFIEDKVPKVHFNEKLTDVEDDVNGSDVVDLNRRYRDDKNYKTF